MLRFLLRLKKISFTHCKAKMPVSRSLTKKSCVPQQCTYTIALIRAQFITGKSENKSVKRTFTSLLTSKPYVLVAESKVALAEMKNFELLGLQWLYAFSY